MDKSFIIKVRKHVCLVLGFVLFGAGIVALVATGGQAFQFVMSCCAVGMLLCAVEATLSGISAIKEKRKTTAIRTWGMAYFLFICAWIFGIQGVPWWPTINLHYLVVKFIFILLMIDVVVLLCWQLIDCWDDNAKEDGGCVAFVLFVIFIIAGIVMILMTISADPSEFVIPDKYPVSSFAELFAK